MDTQQLSDHIAWLDSEASEQEAFLKALDPHSDLPGKTTVGEVLAGLRSTDPGRAESLLEWARRLVSSGSSIAYRSSYRLLFGHREVHRRPWALTRATQLPRLKMIDGTQVILEGCHSRDEDRAIADLRADAVAVHLRARLPPDRLVAIKPHRCSASCEMSGDYIHLARRVEVGIYTVAERLQMGPMRHCANSVREAQRGYVELVDRPQEEEVALEAPGPLPVQDPDMDSWLYAVSALWQEIRPYQEQFKYESIGTLVDHVARQDSLRAHKILERVQEVIDHRMAPRELACLANDTLTFNPHTADFEAGQEPALDDLTAQMNEPDGGTVAFCSGWHAEDEDAALADLRANALLAYFKSRMQSDAFLAVRTHVCGPHCHRVGSQLLRRTGRVEIRCQPRRVLVEDLRIATLRLRG